MTRILLIFGTRPEAIKMAPLYWEFKKNNLFTVGICVTGQHRQMLDQVLDFFEIRTDYDLNLMKDNQTLFETTACCLKELESVLEDFAPDIVFVQGDTTSAFAASIAAFYKKVKVAHVEAGLRSRNKYSPFPEEINRILIGHISDYHFAPTEEAKINLERENVTENVWVTGNTVIDALFWGLRKIAENRQLEDEIKSFFETKFNINSKIILVTGHRRESFGEGFENICFALKEVAKRYKDVQIVYPVHLNPNVREPVNRILGNIENVNLIEPLEYPYLIWLMSKSYIVLTDSGGIQEEAPSLGKPVLVMRDVTEREEGVRAGAAKLVGTEMDNIVSNVNVLLESKKAYERMSKAINPYGDGKAAKRIVKVMREIFEGKFNSFSNI